MACVLFLGLFALSLGVIGKLCSVIVAIPRHLLYYCFMSVKGVLVDVKLRLSIILSFLHHCVDFNIFFVFLSR